LRRTLDLVWDVATLDLSKHNRALPRPSGRARPSRGDAAVSPRSWRHRRRRTLRGKSRRWPATPEVEGTLLVCARLSASTRRRHCGYSARASGCRRIRSCASPKRALLQWGPMRN